MGEKVREHADRQRDAGVGQQFDRADIVSFDQQFGVRRRDLRQCAVQPA